MSRAYFEVIGETPMWLETLTPAIPSVLSGLHAQGPNAMTLGQRVHPASTRTDSTHSLEANTGPYTKQRLIYFLSFNCVFSNVETFAPFLQSKRWKNFSASKILPLLSLF